MILMTGELILILMLIDFLLYILILICVVLTFYYLRVLLRTWCTEKTLWVCVSGNGVG